MPSHLIKDFRRAATLSLLIDAYFFIKRNCRTRLACMLGAGVVAFLQPLAILGASAPVSAQTPALPVLPPYMQPVAPAEPLRASQLAEVAQLPPYIPPLLVAPVWSWGNPYAFGNCTWYVAGRVHVPANLGNATTWAERAVADGYALGPAAVGTVAQKTGGLGHVALVAGVGPGTVTVDEMNVRGLNLVDTATYPVNYFNNYIYFR